MQIREHCRRSEARLALSGHPQPPGLAAKLAAGNLGHWLTPLFGRPAVAFALLFLG